MAIWCFVFLYVIIGVVANDGIPPSNPPLSLEDVTSTAESRILYQVERLARTLSDKINLFNDRVDEMQKVTNRMFDSTNKMLEKLSQNLQSHSTSTTQQLFNLERKLERIPHDTGIYAMQPDSTSNATIEVTRDWTNNHGFGDNWIVFQRRSNGSVNFYRNWTEYKLGFGDLHGEHWLGLDKLHAIVKTRQHELLIVLEDFGGVIAYAHYDDFKIGNESEKYVLKSIGRYSGTAGDSFAYHKGCSFTTYDQDNDNANTNCAHSYGGAWWFCLCYDCHLNGEYLKGKSNRQGGVIWYRFRGLSYSLKSTKMMIRPVG